MISEGRNRCPKCLRRVEIVRLRVFLDEGEKSYYRCPACGLFRLEFLPIAMWD
jgi:hypothetical protein